jgi:nucleotide-binding universal stress UspA family protein
VAVRFLVCIENIQYSRETIGVSISLSEVYHADLSVLHVGKIQKSSQRKDLELSHKKLLEWEIEHPGVQRLNFAMEILKELHFLKLDAGDTPIVRHPFKPSIAGAYEYHLYGIHNENIRLRYREGNVLEEISREVFENPYDLVILGAGGKPKILQKLIYLIDSSIFIIKNFRENFAYRFLFCIDRTEASRHAAMFGINVALDFGARVNILTVGEENGPSQEDIKMADWVQSRLINKGIPYHRTVSRGSIKKSIISNAGDDHIIVMGKSHQSLLKKYIFGSKALSLIKEANSPILLVKTRA